SDVIKNSKESSLETTAKLIASQAEKKYTENQVLDNSSTIKCSDVAKISNADYESCNITFDSKGNAKVSIVGKGKFAGLQVVDGTKDSAKVSVKEDVVETAAKYFSYEEVEGGISIIGYQIGTVSNVEVKDANKCKSYLQSKFRFTEGQATTLCTTNQAVDGVTLQQAVSKGRIPSSDYETAGLKVTYENGGGTDVVIPSQIDGKPVAAIGNSAFRDSDTGLGLGITSVIIPNTITSIGVNAFKGNKLTNVEIPSSITRIGDYAFADNKITLVKFPSTLITLGCDVFYRNPITEDSTYTFPSNVTVSCVVN
ncbi:MAG: leucine-rich repeat domain-containing protein, partial [Tenericutes bacterium]|nr:leucine-rich repeat domain-containing protein [Mycoplasmatota bacterium]